MTCVDRIENILRRTAFKHLSMPMPASAPDGDAALGDVVAQAAEDKTAPSTAAAPARHAGAVPRKRKRKTEQRRRAPRGRGSWSATSERGSGGEAYRNYKCTAGLHICCNLIKINVFFRDSTRVGRAQSYVT